MAILSQLDKRWSAEKIGSSSLTIGGDGCALVSLLNLANALGVNKKNMMPNDLAHNAGCFTSDGLIDFSRACGMIGGLSYVRDERIENDAGIIAALKDPNMAVILNVNHGAHFVLAWRKTYFGPLDFLVADPWGGRFVYAKKFYHTITGARYFKKTGV